MIQVEVPSPSIAFLEAYCGSGSLFCSPAEVTPALGDMVEIVHDKTRRVIATGTVIGYMGSAGAFIVDNFVEVKR
jgi:hypothetical protein